MAFASKIGIYILPKVRSDDKGNDEHVLDEGQPSIGMTGSLQLQLRRLWIILILAFVGCLSFPINLYKKVKLQKNIRIILRIRARRF